MAPGFSTLPSMEEIRQAMEENQLGTAIRHFNVCRIGGYVIKRGAEAVLQEAENMLFLQQYPQIRIPKLYAAFSDGSHNLGKYYIVTEFLEGVMSPERWTSLDSNSQNIVCTKIGEQLRLLNSIPSEEYYYGRIHRQGFRPDLHLLNLRYEGMLGPYNSYNDLLNAMHAAAELRLADWVQRDNFNSLERKFLSTFKSSLGEDSDHDPVLVNLNPELANIIARPVHDDTGKIVDYDVCFIHLEHLFWIPAYMQHVSVETRTLLLCENPERKFLRRVLSKLPGQYTSEMKFLWDCPAGYSLI